MKLNILTCYNISKAIMMAGHFDFNEYPAVKSSFRTKEKDWSIQDVPLQPCSLLSASTPAAGSRP